jgi:class 3 adenylate cyclase
MVAEEPLQERRWELLMVALYRSGRQADALRAYQRARIALGELGLEPGPDLRETERAVSGRDERLALGRPSADEPARPTGVVTFLLTDVEGSSTLWERSPQETATALERHDAVIADAVTGAGGVLLKARGEGDSSFSVFSRTSAAIAAAVAIRDALAADRSPDGVSLAVRLALHTGEAHERGGDSEDAIRFAVSESPGDTGRPYRWRPTEERTTMPGDADGHRDCAPWPGDRHLDRDRPSEGPRHTSRVASPR